MKPRYNQYVYILVYLNQEPFTLYKQKPYMKNKTHFVTEAVLDKYKIDECRRAYSFDEDYGKYWFKSISEAKKFLEANYPKFKFEKISDTHYECVRKKR